MKIAFPKITQEIELSNYAPGVEGRVIAWINPPRTLLKKYSELVEQWRSTEDENERSAALDGVYTIFSELLSQGDEDTRYSVDELKELADGTQETDPQFWIWLQDEILRLVFEHRGIVKKR